MKDLIAQGDLLLEKVPDVPVTGSIIAPRAGVALVLAEGETTGHRHAVLGGATLFRDDGLARDIPDNLYVGHLKVPTEGANLVHEEHAPIALGEGTYRVRRQREIEPKDVRVVAD